MKGIALIQQFFTRPFGGQPFNILGGGFAFTSELFLFFCFKTNKIKCFCFTTDPRAIVSFFFTYLVYVNMGRIVNNYFFFTSHQKHIKNILFFSLKMKIILFLFTVNQNHFFFSKKPRFYLETLKKKRFYLE